MTFWLKRRPGPAPAEARALPHGFATPAAPENGRLGFDYWSTHNSGLFSNCSTTLTDVLALHREGAIVRRIDFSRGMGLYKNRSDSDVYGRFFVFDPAVDVPVGLAFGPLDAHAAYAGLPLADINKAIRRFFTPSREVEALARAWSNAIGLDVAETIAIYFRGTDKGKEIQLAPIEAYIEAARRIDAASGGRRTILVQTDQAQAREAVVAAFGDRARFFAAMPVTRRAKGIHKQWFSRTLTGGAEASALQMLAAVLALSQCAEVVLTTSNVGAWVAFYRGHANGLHQFSAEGRLTEAAPN
jgi:hypothetical protein